MKIHYRLFQKFQNAFISGRLFHHRILKADQVPSVHCRAMWCRSRKDISPHGVNKFNLVLKSTLQMQSAHVQSSDHSPHMRSPFIHHTDPWLPRLHATNPVKSNDPDHIVNNVLHVVRYHHFERAFFFSNMYQRLTNLRQRLSKHTSHPGLFDKLEPQHIWNMQLLCNAIKHVFQNDVYSLILRQLGSYEHDVQRNSCDCHDKIMPNFHGHVERPFFSSEWVSLSYWQIVRNSNMKSDVWFKMFCDIGRKIGCLDVEQQHSKTWNQKPHCLVLVEESAAKMQLPLRTCEVWFFKHHSHISLSLAWCMKVVQHSTLQQLQEDNISKNAQLKNALSGKVGSESVSKFCLNKTQPISNLWKVRCVRHLVTTKCHFH